MITLGSFISAIGLALFNIEADVVPGGVTGLSMTINFVFDYLTVGQLIILLNIPLFIWGVVELGSAFGIRTFYGFFSNAFFIDLLRGDVPGFRWLHLQDSATIQCSRTISFSSSSSAAFSSALGLVSSSSSRARRLGQKSSVRFSRSALEYRRGFR